MGDTDGAGEGVLGDVVAWFFPDWFGASMAVDEACAAVTPRCYWGVCDATVDGVDASDGAGR